MRFSVESRAWRPWTAKAIFESALIVFSVLLALTVDGCREQAQRRRQLTEARASLVQELEFNRNLLREPYYLAYHLRLLKIYRDMESSEGTEGRNELFKDGVHVALLRDAAWRSFVPSTIAGEMSFRSRAILAGVYAEQDLLTNIHYFVLGSLMTPSADRDHPSFVRDQIRVIRHYLEDVTAAEQRLLAAYDETIKQLQAN
jgi:hypothetical protein